jgi:hypothetical protein
MTGHARTNGKGSTFPYHNGFAAYTWVTKPDGQRQRKYIYSRHYPTPYTSTALHRERRTAPTSPALMPLAEGAY